MFSSRHLSQLDEFLTGCFTAGELARLVEPFGGVTLTRELSESFGSRTSYVASALSGMDPPLLARTDPPWLRRRLLSNPERPLARDKDPGGLAPARAGEVGSAYGGRSREEVLEGFLRTSLPRAEEPERATRIRRHCAI